MSWKSEIELLGSWFWETLLSIIPKPIYEAWNSPLYELTIYKHKDNWFFKKRNVFLVNTSAPVDFLTKDNIHNNLNRRIGRITLLLDKDQFFSREYSFPVASKKYLNNIALYELERTTPISRANILSDINVKYIKNSKIHIDHIVIEKKRIINILETLKDNNINLERISIQKYKNSFSIKIENTKKYLNILNVAILFLISATVILLSSNIYRVKYENSKIIKSLKKDIVRIKHNIKTREIASKTENTSFDIFTYPRVKKNNSIRISKIISDLSKYMPKDSWVSSLSINEKYIEIKGYSSNSIYMVNSILMSPYFSTSKFISPTTKDYTSKTEKFSLRIYIHQE